MNTIKFAKKLAIPLFVALAYGPAQGLAAPLLGSALSSFAVLAETGVTSASISTIGGNLGSITGGATGTYIVSGSSEFNSLLAQNAQAALTALTASGGALNYMGAGTAIGVSPIAGLGNLNWWANNHGGVITPGTYTVAAQSAVLGGNVSGALILDGQGLSNAVWKFLFPTTLITNDLSTVTVINPGTAPGLYWSVGTGATLDGNTFAGNVIAQTLISNDDGLMMGCGRLLSAGTQVTLNSVASNTTISTGCLGTGSGSGGFDQVAAIPEPETYAMLLAGLGLMGFVARRRQRNRAAAA